MNETKIDRVTSFCMPGPGPGSSSVQREWRGLYRRYERSIAADKLGDIARFFDLRKTSDDSVKMNQLIEK